MYLYVRYLPLDLHRGGRIISVLVLADVEEAKFRS